MYRVTFAITAPAEYAGRTVRRPFVFTPKSLPYVRRDLLRFGLASRADLLRPFPADTVFVCKLAVAQQTLDDGRRVNDVKNVEVVGTEPAAPPAPDGFAYTPGERKGVTAMAPPPDAGLYVRGPLDGRRTLIRHADLFAAYCDLDGRIDPAAEAYLSGFAFGDVLAGYFARNGHSERGYAGPAWSRWVWLDIDRPDIDAAIADARKLARVLVQRYPKLDGEIPAFFSGRKGLHLGVELTHCPRPSPLFPPVCRRLAEGWAADAGVAIDVSVYSKTRLLRLPNSRHGGSGLHKVLIPYDDPFRVSATHVREMARHPVAFDMPTAGDLVTELEADWDRAERELATTPIRPAGVAAARAAVPKYVLDLIRFGVEEGERALVVFRSAAVLTEMGCPPAAVSALLTEPGRDCGLPAGEVERQIRCGVEHARRQMNLTNN